MSPWKQAALAAYYHGTRPYRALWNRRACRARRAPVMILFYHRIADDRANVWTCPRKLFAEQMAWLRKHCDVVTLAEAQHRIRTGNPRPAAVVTFDDGYGENDDFALPHLVEHQMPATYFVTLHHVRHGVPFPHDMRMGNTFRPNTIGDLRKWAETGLIEIGAHTRTHPDIGAITDRTRLEDEIVAAGEELQQLLGRAVRYFAFPFGLPSNMQPAAFELAYEAGYEGVCSAYGAYNFPGNDPFHLQRIHADDDLLRFRNWLSVDPRKLKIPRYEYHSMPTPTKEAQIEGFRRVLGV